MPHTDIVILKTLLEAEGVFVSGNDLANKIGISRVGVWARLEKLREEQFEVEAVRHRGYRLIAEPPVLNQRLIAAYLQIMGVEIDVCYRDHVDSTNTEAARELAHGRATPFCIVASEQTKGRGRLGRKWHSPNEGNVYASFAMRPNLPPIKMQAITLWIGLKLTEQINETLNIPVRLKWPNDLLLDGRKVAGMLAEARVDADRIHELVFGIGLNVNGQVSDWPEEVAAHATSLAHYKGETLLINRLAAEMLHSVMQACRHFLEEDIAEEMRTLWDRYNALGTQKISFQRKKETFQGTVRGINGDGSLLVEQEDGAVHSLNSGEVSIGSANLA